MTSTSRELLHRLAVTQSSERLPSVVAAVARDGATAWAAGRGAVNGTEPTADTQYRIGSISKTFVATLVMRMRDQGELRIDDTVGRYLPDVPVRDATIFHLLSHTSGLATETPPPWWERSAGDLRPELDNLFWADPFRHPAGRRWHYSNTGYGVLGAIIGAIRGADWFAVL